MATRTTPPTKRAPAKRSSSGRRPPPPPTLSSRLASTTATVLRGHAGDAIGLGLVLVGLIAALGTYVDLAGPAGRGLAALGGTFIGLGRYLLPPSLVAIGVALMAQGTDDKPTETTTRAHLGIGSGLVGLSALGLIHLARGARWGDPLRELRAAGGLIGAFVAAPLTGLLASTGASLVLGAVGVLGLVVLTRTPVHTAAASTANGMRPIGGLILRGARSLFSLEPIGGTDTAYDDIDIDLTRPSLSIGGVLYDQDADKPRRSKAKADATTIDPAPDGPRPVVFTGGEEEQTEQLAIDLVPGDKRSTWKLPPSKFLERTQAASVDAKAVEDRGRLLEASLAQHGVDTRLVGMVVGPTVTRYELELGDGVKVSKLTSLHKDIAYAMASPDVRILAPIPGRRAIGVEVPNADRQIVSLGDILNSEEATRAKHPLEVAVGRDINGKSVLMNLAHMPHILIAGATGAGKSSCLNSLITSVLMRSSPDQVRMILIDPKRVEMGQYDKLPHLLTQVVTNPKKAANALAWAVKEMERRYDLLSEIGVRDITGYNSAFDRGDLNRDRDPERDGPLYERLPFVLVVVDELADLMMVAARDVEDSICRLAQMARAVGIHLVIATQRPSVNVITGVIKANVPARLAFAVSSLTDSRVILDQGGAERLVGKGDMLLLGPASSAPRRIQGAWVSEEEVRKVTGHWRRQAPTLDYSEEVQGETGPGGTMELPGGSSGNEDDDDLLWQAMEIIVRSQLGSTSMLQRKLKVGFARAGRLMDLLEQRGVVGPSIGSKAREVLMTEEELNELLDRQA